MIDQENLSVVEFNIRFGDPETQVVLPRLENDLLEVFEAILDKKLHTMTLKWKKESAICVVFASGGYPGSYEKNKLITGIDKCEEQEDIHVIQAGTKRNNENDLLTSGGRVLAVVGLDEDLERSISKTYTSLKEINFENVVLIR